MNNKHTFLSYIELKYIPLLSCLASNKTSAAGDNGCYTSVNNRPVLIEVGVQTQTLLIVNTKESIQATGVELKQYILARYVGNSVVSANQYAHRNNLIFLSVS